MLASGDGIERKRSMRRSGGDLVFNVAVYLILLVIALLVLYPLYFTIIASISSPYAVAKGEWGCCLSTLHLIRIS